MKEPRYKSREEWLQEAVKLMTPMFKGHNYDVPALYVSAGWPSKGGKGGQRQTLGECWNKAASADKKSQIFLSPASISPLDHKAEGDNMGVLPTLVHEVVHAVVGVEQKHGKAFSKCARAVGLEGALTSTHAGEDLAERCKQWLGELGPYPHAVLSPTLSGIKKQTTRMIKCECGCGYIARTSKKNLLDIGAPICPNKKCNFKPMKFELPDEDEGEE